MSTRLLILIFSVLFFNLNYAQDFHWVRQLRGVNSDYSDEIKAITVDNNNNSYIIGETNSYSFDLDPTESGTDIVINNIQNFHAAYIVKVDEDGNYKWGKMFGNFRRGDYPIGIKVGTDGNIYAAVSVSEEISDNNADTYINVMKFTPEGIILSENKIPQHYSQNNGLHPLSFELDAQNNIYITGWFTGVIPISTTNTSLNLSAIGASYFLIKINNIGNIAWTKQFDLNSNMYSNIKIRPDGNLNIALYSDADTNYKLYNINTTNGSIIWEKEFQNQSAQNLHVSNNAIIISGTNGFDIPIDVDPSATSVVTVTAQNYLLFLDLNGSFVDVKEFFNPSSFEQLRITAITTDENNKCFITGTFYNTVDFDPNPSGIFNMTATGQYAEAFYVIFDENRNFEDAFKFGDENPKLDPYHNCYSIKISDLKVIDDISYIAGNFFWSCDFDPSPVAAHTLKTIQISTINSDGFIQKLGTCNDNPPVRNLNQEFCSAEIPTVSSLSPQSSSIKWYGAQSDVAPLAGNVALIDGHTYYVSKKSGNCPESARMAVTVTIKPSPGPPTATDQIFCKSENAKLQDMIISGQDIKWYNTANGAEELLPETLLLNATYYATQTLNGCESLRNAIKVTIDDTPEPIVATEQTFCFKDNPSINSISVTGQNIKWYASLTDSTTIPSETLLQDDTIYYITQTLNNCESLRKSIHVVIQNTPPPAASQNQTLCAMQTPTLDDIVIEGSNIKWYDNDINRTVVPATTELQDGYTYFATQTINGCESILRTPIKITLITKLNGNDYQETICDKLNDGIENVDLKGFNNQIIEDASSYNFEYYLTLNGALKEFATERISQPENYVILSGDKTIYVRITATNGCFQIVKLNLTLFTFTNVNLNEDIILCKDKSVMLNAGNNFDSYVWSTGAKTESILVRKPGDYKVEITKNIGNVFCTSLKSFTVTESQPAVITNIKTTDWTDNNNAITIYTEGSGNYEYSIDGIYYQSDNTFSNLAYGLYTVYVIDKNGCGITDEEIVLLTYSKFFTPNGDGTNDTWSIKYSFYEKDINVNILNRYGKILTNLKPGESWDGKYNGHEVPSDDYWFVVNRANGKQHKGHFSLIR